MIADIDPCERRHHVAHPSTGRVGLPLASLHIHFYTSVAGRGGSEVLLADAMEAAHLAGANVTCWSEPRAAIRDILAARATGVRVAFRDWPPQSAIAGSINVSNTSASPPHRGVNREWLQLAWRRSVPGGIKRFVGFINGGIRFRRALAATGPDLFVASVNGSEAAALGGGLWSRRRTVTCYHLSWTPVGGTIFDRTADWTTRWMTLQSGARSIHTSQAVRNQWCGRYRYHRSRVKVIYNGVANRSYANRGAVRTSLGVSERAFLIAVPARFDWVKGHEVLIRALESVPAMAGDTRVLFCGEGSLQAELERRVAAAGLGQTVQFLGHRNDLPDVLAASDCVVLPSLASENLSVAVLEGLMAGVPAIVSRVGGMGEAVQDGRTGFVVPPNHPLALRNAIMKMIADPVLVQTMGAEARADALRRFTRERMMAEYVMLFASMVVESRGMKKVAP